MTIEEHTDAVQYVRQHPRLFFGDAPPSAASCVHQLLDELFALGGSLVTVAHHEAWWVLSSDVDWFLDDRSDCKQVRQIVPLPELGPNSCRKEIIAVAFGRAFATRKAQTPWILLSGLDEVPPGLEALGATSEGRAVAFRF